MFIRFQLAFMRFMLRRVRDVVARKDIEFAMVLHNLSEEK